MDFPLIEHIGLNRPVPVNSGWSRVLYRGPRTLSEVLRDASAAMDAEDARQAMAADPFAFVIAQRRRNLLGRLLGRL
jgi:hypothetical protein